MLRAREKEKTDNHAVDRERKDRDYPSLISDVYTFFKQAREYCGPSPKVLSTKNVISFKPTHPPQLMTRPLGPQVHSKPSCQGIKKRSCVIALSELVYVRIRQLDRFKSDQIVIARTNNMLIKNVYDCCIIKFKVHHV